MAFWLFKTEPDVFSIDDLKREQQSGWEGIRNYQARNRLRDEVQVGDDVLIYHSNAKPPGVVGLAKVCKAAEPDPFQFNPDSKYHDPKSDPANPRWQWVTVQYVAHAKTPLWLPDIKADPFFAEMELVTRSRLSIQKVDEIHAREILKRTGMR